MCIIIFSFVLILASCTVYNYSIKAVSDNSEKKEFEIVENDTYLNIASKLKNSNLIRSELFYKVYVKIFKPKKLEIGIYQLSQNMDVSQIIEVLEHGNDSSAEVVNITFKEGLNMRGIASVISRNTSNSEGSVYDKLNDSMYLDSLIKDYWFIDENIKNNKIYYSLEGYLFPDTYQFKKDVTVEEIFKVMLDEMGKKLEPYKSDVMSNKYSIHEIITIASIVELEASNSDDRKGVAGVFYNRLEDGWSLGSDVTTYYAEKVDLSERELSASEFNSYNAYNTRSSKMAGKLPVGPICNPSKESIEASIYPTKHNYYYFVADKNKKTYFNINESDHNKTIAKLKSENLWFEY